MVCQISEGYHSSNSFSLRLRRFIDRCTRCAYSWSLGMDIGLNQIITGVATRSPGANQSRFNRWHVLARAYYSKPLRGRPAYPGYTRAPRMRCGTASGLRLPQCYCSISRYGICLAGQFNPQRQMYPDGFFRITLVQQRKKLGKNTKFHTGAKQGSPSDCLDVTMAHVHAAEFEPLLTPTLLTPRRTLLESPHQHECQRHRSL
jgi:hypothetical protein